MVDSEVGRELVIPWKAWLVGSRESVRPRPILYQARATVWIQESHWKGARVER